MLQLFQCLLQSKLGKREFKHLLCQLTARTHTQTCKSTKIKYLSNTGTEASKQESLRYIVIFIPQLVLEPRFFLHLFHAKKLFKPISKVISVTVLQ